MSKETKRILLQILLFIVTFITTTLAGAEWTHGRSIFMEDFGWNDFIGGMEYSIPFLLILTVHEFGHYFTAIYYKVKTSLPYYIPFPPILFSIGTMGAMIRLRNRVPSKVQNFDIGIAGPLAGFIMTVIILFYGFTHLPSADYIFEMHPEYKVYGANYADFVYKDMKPGTIDVMIGDNLLFYFFKNFVADPALVPNPHELMHYPFLLAGFISLVFTCLNLLPIGQLDGGHVVYGLFGYRIHRIIATVFFTIVIFYAGFGFVKPTDPPDTLVMWAPGYLVFLYLAFSGLKLSKRDTLMYAILMFAVQFGLSWMFPGVEGYSGWLLFVFVIGMFIGIDHPPCEIEEPLDGKRIALGWLAVIIFILCFSPAPLVMKVFGE
ncbi:MAG TPA: site-2 protease family protein [Chryseolinea sp.]|nr:site-2 protease family protein [Chryseolinea sp.]HPM29575.1 site-2 protease family protein [Chryseolinea sp.]